MKVTFSSNNYISKYQTGKASFGAGLTPGMLQDIQHSSLSGIADKLTSKGIPNNLGTSKVLSWCCAKTVDILEAFNQKFNTNLSLPSGIFAVDFKDLNIKGHMSYAFCNLAPTQLIKGSKQIFPSRLLLFNTQYDWDNINAIADDIYDNKQSVTNFFLYPILHESAHVMHENHLLEQFDEKTVFRKILSARSPLGKFAYRLKYGDKVANICKYGATNPLEAIACDLPLRLVNALDIETLTPKKDPFIGTPYGKDMCHEKNSNKHKSLDEILFNFWNGRF